MKKGDIVLNKWAGENNPCRISIITYIGTKFTNAMYLHNGNLRKCQLYTYDLKTDKEHFEVIDHLDYEKVIRDKLSELKRSDNNAE